MHVRVATTPLNQPLQNALRTRLTIVWQLKSKWLVHDAVHFAELVQATLFTLL